MANINKAFPSKYLRADDLGKREHTLVIDRVDIEKIGEDERLVIYFRGKQKALVCNKTNAKAIAKGYGDETDDWRGKDVILFPTVVQFKAEMVDAIRVKLPFVDPGAGASEDEVEF